MDPSTSAHSAHIDPAALHVGTGPDGAATLNVAPSTVTSSVHATSSSTPLSGAPSGSATSTPKTSTTGSTTSSSTTPAATGLRQRVNSLGTQLDHAAEHPAVQNAKGAAQKQVGQLREVLGRSQTIRDLEKKTNVDRVVLVFGGVFAYLLLIPLNLFGLALPTTTLLTLLPPSFLALGILEAKIPNEQNEAATRALLSYFVTLGFIQFLESLAAGVLERRIPQYYTVKLLFLAYLLHPRTQGAMNLHAHVFRPLLAHASAATPTHTPPQSDKAAGYSTSPTQSKSTASSSTAPTFGSSASNSVPTGASSATGTTAAAHTGFDGAGNITRQQAAGEHFAVVNELH